MVSILVYLFLSSTEDYILVIMYPGNSASVAKLENSAGSLTVTYLEYIILSTLTLKKLSTEKLIRNARPHTTPPTGQFMD